GDKIPRFDQVYQALLALRKKTESLKPQYEGKCEWNWFGWKPVKFPGTKTAMKGWELYMWEQDGNSCFSLRDGTNRLKNDDEIAAVAVKGIDVIKRRLDELQPGQAVFLRGRSFASEPPKEQASVVDEYCTTIGMAVPLVDLPRTQAAVFFRVEKDPPDMTGFEKPWTLGSESARYSESRQEVLVIDQTKPGALRIGGFPKDYGRIATTGWKDGRFFVHVKPDVESGFMIYCDLKTQQVTEVEHWAAF
ncbi:MAG TPA: hypothetical protein VMY42_06675, partial [Thermoguttaceae bacterium]|nr:hypothetical protein [Thermoguttaceae bacterium]